MALAATGTSEPEIGKSIVFYDGDEWVAYVGFVCVGRFMTECGARARVASWGGALS